MHVRVFIDTPMAYAKNARRARPQGRLDNYLSSDHTAPADKKALRRAGL
jgi:hypothetical protein